MQNQSKIGWKVKTPRSAKKLAKINDGKSIRDY